MGIKQIKIGTKDFIGVYINGVKRDFFVGVSKVAEGEPVTPVEEVTGITIPAGTSIDGTYWGENMEELPASYVLTEDITIDPLFDVGNFKISSSMRYFNDLSIELLDGTILNTQISAAYLYSPKDSNVVPTSVVSETPPYYPSTATSTGGNAALASALLASYTGISSGVTFGTLKKAHGAKMVFEGLEPNTVYSTTIYWQKNYTSSSYYAKTVYFYDDTGVQTGYTNMDITTGNKYSSWSIPFKTDDTGASVVHVVVFNSGSVVSASATYNFGKYSDAERLSTSKKFTGNFDKQMVLSVYGHFGSETDIFGMNVDFGPKYRENGNYSLLSARLQTREKPLSYFNLSESGKITNIKDIQDPSELWSDYYIFDKENNTLQILQNGYYGSSSFTVEDAPRTIEAYIPATAKQLLDSLVSDTETVYGTEALLCKGDALMSSLGYSTDMALLMCTYTMRAQLESLGLSVYSIGYGSCVDTTAAEVTYNIDLFNRFPHEF